MINVFNTNRKIYFQMINDLLHKRQKCFEHLAHSSPISTKFSAELGNFQLI